MALLAECEAILQRSADQLKPALAAGSLDDIADAGERLLRGCSALDQGLLQLCSRDVGGVCKEPAASLEQQERGRRAFGHGQHAEAAVAFGQSLRLHLASGDGSARAAVLLANRALCLLRMRPPDPQQALADCERALRLDGSNAKALYRKLQALLALERWAEAHAAAAAALEAEMLKPGEAAEVTKLQQQADAALARQAHASPAAQPSSAESSSAAQPGLLALAESKQEGRHWTAAADIPAGACVLEEQPLVALIAKQLRKTHCWRCFGEAPDETACWCPDCAAARYCSWACCEGDGCHRMRPLCGAPWPLLLPLEGPLAACLAAHAQAAGAVELQTHFSSLTLPELLPNLALACVTAACWTACMAGPSKPGADSCQPLRAADVLRALLQIRVNGIAVVPPLVASAQDRAALAVYPGAALLNHACVPSVAFSFEGRRLRVAAAQSIRAGEALRHCYGPQVGDMVAEQRQRLLQEQYHFACRCDACLRPPASEHGMVAVRCLACDGPLRLTAPAPAGLCSLHALPAGTGRCARCGAALPPGEERRLLAELGDADAAFRQATALLQESAQKHAEAALRLLTQCLQVQEHWLFSSNQRLGQTRHSLGCLLAQVGQRDAARPHLLLALEAAEAAYPPGSAVVANQRALCASLLAD